MECTGHWTNRAHGCAGLRPGRYGPSRVSGAAGQTEAAQGQPGLRRGPGHTVRPCGDQGRVTRDEPQPPFCNMATRTVTSHGLASSHLRPAASGRGAGHDERIRATCAQWVSVGRGRRSSLSPAGPRPHTPDGPGPLRPAGSHGPRSCPGRDPAPPHCSSGLSANVLTRKGALKGPAPLGPWLRPRHPGWQRPAGHTRWQATLPRARGTSVWPPGLPVGRAPAPSGTTRGGGLWYGGQAQTPGGQGGTSVCDMPSHTA